MNSSLKHALVSLLMPACLVAFCVSATAQSPTRVGSWPGYNRRGLSAVAVSGNYAYATGLHGGMQIIDIRNPAVPVPVGGYNPNGDLPYPQATADNVAVSGNYAYVVFGFSAGRKGLHVVDVTDPHKPVGLGRLFGGNNCVDVAVAGNFAYVAAEAAGLRIADVSNPAIPLQRGTYNTSGTARGVAVAGQFAYVADGSAGLQIVDISNPSVPVRVGVLNTSGEAYDVAIAGQHAYVADGASGLQIIDVSNPAAPVSVAEIHTGSEALGVAVSGSLAYVAASTRGLIVIDVSNPAAPFEVGGIGTPAQLELDAGHSTGSVRAGNVAVAGNHAFVAHRDGDVGIDIINVSDPASPQREGYHGVGDTWAVTLAGRHLYVSDTHWVQILDLTNPTMPKRIGGVFEKAYDVSVAFDHAYVHTYTQGLLVFDVGGPTQPLPLGRYGEGYRFGKMAVRGRHAYTWVYDPVLQSDQGLQILDLANPAKPTVAGTYHPSGSVGAFSGHLAFVTVESGLHVVDVSNPAAPVRVGQLNLGAFFQSPGGFTFDPHIAGMIGPHHLCVVQNTGFPDYDSVLHMIDVSDPAAPRSVKTLSFPNPIEDATVAGNFILVSYDEYGGFRVIDVSNPTLPVIKWTLPTPVNSTFYPEQIVVSGEYAYCANSYGGVAVVRIPALAVQLGIERSADGVRLSWPATATGFTLESTSALLPETLWSPLTNDAQTVGDRFVLTTDSDTGAAFFRLRKP